MMAVLSLSLFSPNYCAGCVVFVSTQARSFQAMVEHAQDMLGIIVHLLISGGPGR